MVKVKQPRRWSRRSAIAAVGLICVVVAAVHFLRNKGGKLQLQSTIAAPKDICEELPSWLHGPNSHLAAHERKIFSQYGEDGITLYLVDHVLQINSSNSKFFVEFGVESGMECNTRVLREHRQWRGLLMDGGNQNVEINLRKEMIHPNTIVSLFEKHEVPKEFGYFSEDTDYADYYVWRAILEAGYRPRILVSEINSNFEDYEAGTVHKPPDDQPRFWQDNNNYFGVSPLALSRLWNRHGYIMVYCTSNQVNCFGVQAQDILKDYNHQTNRERLKAAQECLWKKPIAWRNAIHPCDRKVEQYHRVGEDGQVDETEDFQPEFVRQCEKRLINR